MDKHEWIKITPFDDPPDKHPFLLLDQYGAIHVGFTARDYYDAIYWFPLPSYTEGYAEELISTPL